MKEGKMSYEVLDEQYSSEKVNQTGEEYPGRSSMSDRNESALKPPTMLIRCSIMSDSL